MCSARAKRLGARARHNATRRGIMATLKMAVYRSTTLRLPCPKTLVLTALDMDFEYIHSPFAVVRKRSTCNTAALNTYADAQMFLVFFVAYLVCVLNSLLHLALASTTIWVSREHFFCSSSSGTPLYLKKNPVPSLHINRCSIFSFIDTLRKKLDWL